MPEATHNFSVIGLTKGSLDPQSIVTSTSTTVDFPKVFQQFGSASTYSGIKDSDNQYALAEMIAARENLTPPAPKLKVVGVAFERDAAGNLAGTLATCLWGYWDSKDQQEKAETQTVTDPTGIISSGQFLTVDGTANAPTGQVVRTVANKEIPGGHYLTAVSTGTRTAQQDEEMPGTQTVNEASGLEITGRETFIHYNTASAPSGSVPTGSKLISTIVQPFTNFHKKTVLVYGPRTAQEEIEWLQSKSTAESGALEQQAIVVEVTGSSTPSASGDNPDDTNLSYHSSVSYRLKDDKWVHAHLFKPLTATESVQEDAKKDETDPASLTDAATRCVVDGNATAPSAPAVSGLTHVQTQTKRIGKAKYRHVYAYAYRTSAGQLEADKTAALTDIGGLESEATTADVYTGSEPSDPSPPTGLVLRSKRDLPTPNPAYTLRVYQWALATSADELVRRGTSVTHDPSLLASESKSTALYGTSGLEAGSLAVPAGLLLVETQSQNLPSGHTAVTAIGGMMTHAEKLTRPNTYRITDPSSLNSSGRTLVLWNATASMPTPDAAMGDLVLTDYKTHSENSSINAVLANYGVVSSATELLNRQNYTLTDPDGLASRMAKSTLTSATLSDLTGLEIYDTKRQMVGTQLLTVTEYGVQSRAKEMANKGTSYTLDPSHLRSEAQSTAILGTAGAIAGSTTLPGSLVTREVRTQNIDSGHTAVTYVGSTRTAEQDVTFPNTFVQQDVSNLGTTGKAVIFYAASSSAPSGTTYAPSGLVLVATKTMQETSGGVALNRAEFAFAQQTPAQEYERQRTFTVTDPSNVRSEAQVTVLNYTGSLLDGTANLPTGIVARGIKVQTLNPSNTAYEWTGGMRSTTGDITYPNTWAILDTSSLNSSAQIVTTSTGSLSAPNTSLSVGGTTLVLAGYKTHSEHSGLHVQQAEYATQTTAQAQVNRTRRATRSVVEPHTARLSSGILTVDASSTPDTIADDIAVGFPAYRWQTNFRDLTVIKHDPTHAEVIYDYVNSGTLVEYGASLAVNRKAARISGGNTQMYVVRNEAYGGGLRFLTFTSALSTRPVRRFSIRRMASGTSVPDYTGLLGKANAETFLGLSASTVLYERVGGSVKVEPGVTSNYYMSYAMLNDPDGFVVDVPEDLLEMPQLVATSETASGWVNISGMKLNGSSGTLISSLVYPVDTATFSVFL